MCGSNDGVGDLVWQCASVRCGSGGVTMHTERVRQQELEWEGGGSRGGRGGKLPMQTWLQLFFAFVQALSAAP